MSSFGGCDTQRRVDTLLFSEVYFHCVSTVSLCLQHVYRYTEIVSLFSCIPAFFKQLGDNIIFHFTLKKSALMSILVMQFLNSFSVCEILQSVCYVHETH